MARALSVEGLRLHYAAKQGVVRAVDGVSLELERGELLAVVGESGSGKSSLGYAIAKLLPENAVVYDGRVVLYDDGREFVVSDMGEEELRREIRWRRMAMVFQASMNSLDPVSKIGDTMLRFLRIHRRISREEGLELAAEALKSVGLPEAVLDLYPFELSGGMKQRVAIALALMLRPTLVILDEPTSALDVITQANILSLLRDLKGEAAMILITHDIALASEIADRIAVMYAGRIVEEGPADELLERPLHPYTAALLAATPSLRGEKKLSFIPGQVPSLMSPPPGCRFHPRCPLAYDVCRREEPPMVEAAPRRRYSCWLAKGGA